MTLNWGLVGYVKRSKNRQQVLRILSIPLSPSDIAKKLKISLTHASKIIRELNAKGLVKCLNEELKVGRIYQKNKVADEILDYLSKTDK
ncbi:winged helix DNA-binding protein [Candidatus Woesearchaeota archaeon]|nr:winged helix DNA-binding protein [Candidatus Woesearchaeota archaeon]